MILEREYEVFVFFFYFKASFSNMENTNVSK